MREEEKASMLNILLGHGPGAPNRETGPSRRSTETVVVSQWDTCVVPESTTHALSEPHLSFVAYVGGHGGCYVPPKENILSHNLDWLTNKQKSSDKNNGKGVCLSDSDLIQTSQI